MLLFCCAFGGYAQFSPQSKGITEKFFPDPEVDINTPAFEKRRGFSEYEDMMPYLRKLRAAHPTVVEMHFIGQSQKGDSIPFLRIRKPGLSHTPLRVWMQGGLHGNEPASTEGMLYLLDRLLNDTAYAYLLDSLELGIVPMANIDGTNKESRYAANGLDLNRDQTKLMAPESVFLKAAFNAFDPQVAVDFHEYRPFRKDYLRLGDYGMTAAYDVMFLYSGNLNVPEPLRNYTKSRFVSHAKQTLTHHQLTHHDYFSSTRVLGALQFNQGSLNARSSATSYALANTVSSLIEIRGVGLERTSFKRRVYSTFLVAKAYLEMAYTHPTEVRQAIQQAAQGRNDSTVVRHKSLVENRPVSMIDLDKQDTVKIDGRVRDAWYSHAVLSRKRPTAYLLMPDQQELVKKMIVLGLEVELLQTPQNLEVEQFRVTEYQQEAAKYEGVYRQEVQTEVSTVEHSFPAGTYLVYMDQAKANLAQEVLEPEAPNSFVSFSVLPTEKGQVLPVFRYVKTNRLAP
jgi:hypothetical protein